MSLFSNNLQLQQTNPTTGGLFSNNINNPNSTSLFGAPSKNENQNQKGSLFGNINLNSNESKSQSFFGNQQNTPSNNLFSGFSKEPSNTTSQTKPQTNTLFGVQNSNTSNAPIGIFQNNTNTNNEKPALLTNNLFGNISSQDKVENSQKNVKPKNKEENSPLFGTQQQPKEKNINTEQNKPNLFSNNPLGGNSLFAAPKEEKKPEVSNNTSNQAQNQTQTQKKEENKTQSVLFGNNINNQPGIGSGNLFGNEAKKEKLSLNINTNPNQEEKTIKDSSNNNTNINQNDQNQNKINNNINQGSGENYLNIKFPEQPFELTLGTSKEIEAYEKNKLLHKTNQEIVEDFKNMLFNQKSKYKQCIKNTREFEQKLMGIMEITEANASMSGLNEKKGKKIIQKLNSINYQSKNLENIVSKINERLDQILNPYKDNVINSDKIFLNQNDSQKFKFFENMIQISDKCYKIENDLNEAEQNFTNKEKEREERTKEKDEGLWIERDKGKIFVNQNMLNGLYNDCYEGLSNLKEMQDDFDKKYEMLKYNIMKNTKKEYLNSDIINNNFNNFY